MSTDIPDFGRLVDKYTRNAARYVFELLVQDLVITEMPDAKAIRPNPGDSGIDAFVGTYGNMLTVFQSKFFIEGLKNSQKDQIRRSFQRVYSDKDTTPTNWILVIPIDLDLEEQKWFDQWKRKQDIDIDYWGATRLRALLAKYPWFIERYFKTGTEAINAKVIEVLTAMSEGLARMTREPKPHIGFLDESDVLTDVLDVGFFDKDLEYKQTLSSQISKSDYLLDRERLGREYGDLVEPEEIDAHFESYTQEWNTFKEDLESKFESKAGYANQHFIFPAVENAGTTPLVNAHITMKFPSSIILSKDENADVSLDSPPISLDTRIFELHFSRLKKRNEADQPSQLLAPFGPYPDLMASISRLDPLFQQLQHLAGAAALPLSTSYYPIDAHIPSLSIPPLVYAQTKPTRSSIEIDSSSNTASFWLRKVMHDYHINYPYDGFFVEVRSLEPVSIYCEIIADNLPSRVSKELEIRLSGRGILHLPEWSPFHED
ncbi:MAG: hypothetical protein KAR39_03990 [Thermoplasmata archaeon]|nr:hypothetical protein [Thermoplasmata archaeon]